MQEGDGGGGGLDAAIRRLDRAVVQLEARVCGAVRQAHADGGQAHHQDRANLAAQLDEASSREKELQQAGAQAALALGRAIAEIRAALGEDVAAVVQEEA